MTLSSIERIKIKLPAGFDPRRHQQALLAKITKDYGEGFEIDSIDPAEGEHGTATASRQVATTEIRKQGESFEVRLARGTKPTDGERQAARLEDQYPGYAMTRFEPFLGKATLTKLTDDELRCRGAVAVALGVKPWDVDVTSSADGGFHLGLPKTYLGSKHDEKLDEVATTVVGRDGWYVSVDAQKLTARIIPADPPTFPSILATPLDRLGRGDAMLTPFGMTLPRPGAQVGEVATIDWRASGSAVVSGLAGGGKSVTITAILADRVSNGAFLAVVDTPDKAVDFLKFKDMCAVRGVDGSVIPAWGCDSLGHAVAVLALLCEEGKKRAKVLAELGINNWLTMPEEKRFRPVFIVADEYEALVTREPVPKALPKDHPMRVEAEQANMAHDLIAHYMNRIVKEFRFVGLNPLISTQVSNASTGLPPSLKSKMGHFLLCGSTPSEAARRQAFPDEKAVPRVPDNVANGGPAGRGSGSAKIEGGGAFVFKSFFATIDDYQAALHRLGVDRFDLSKVTPTQQQIDEFLPSLEEDEDDGKGRGRRAPTADRSPISGRSLAEIGAEMGDPDAGWDRDADGKKLTGFERANAARHAVANPGGKTQKQKREAAEEDEWASRSGAVTTSQVDTAADGW